MIRSVDVVIPVYNAGDHISDTVRHVSEQQVPEGSQLNIYAVDDGSTDDTPKRLSQLKESIPELHVGTHDM